MNIGVFDSGIGGLSVLRTITNELPHYSYLYFGDNAHMPYGEKTPQEIYDLTCQAIEFFYKKDCRIVILACNTATSVLRRVQREYLTEHQGYPKVLGVIRPTAEAIIAEQSEHLAMIATSATVESNSFIHETAKITSEKITIDQRACPELASLIEQGELSGPILRKSLRKYIDPLLKKGTDTLLLGCTHYELILPELQALYGKTMRILTESAIVADAFKDYLSRHKEITKDLDMKGDRTYYFSHLDTSHIRFVRSFMDSDKAVISSAGVFTK